MKMLNDVLLREEAMRLKEMMDRVANGLNKNDANGTLEALSESAYRITRLTREVWRFNDNRDMAGAPR